MPKGRTSSKSVQPVRASRSMRIPTSIPFKLNVVSVLVILLIVAAFLLGVLVTKVSYLEKGTSGTTNITGAQPSTAPAGITLGDKKNLNAGHLPAKGQDNAKITLVEFADFQCPFCEKWFTDVESNLIKDYVDTGKVKFAFRHYAFLGQESTDAANAAECANDQGKFWEYHDYLYTHQGSENSGAFAKDKLKQFGADLGLDTTTFNDCVERDLHKDLVAKDLTEGQAVGVDGTPATFINGQMVLSGGSSAGALPYTDLKNLIDQELSK